MISNLIPNKSKKLSTKTILPMLTIFIAAMFIFVAIIYNNSNKVLTSHLEERVREIIEIITVISEIDSGTQQITKVLQGFSAASDIKDIHIFNIESNTILSSNRTAVIGDTISNKSFLGNHTYKFILESTKSKFAIDSYDAKNIFIGMQKTRMISHNRDRYIPVIIIVTIDPNKELINITNALITQIILIISLTFIIFIIWQQILNHVVIKPIKQFINVMQDSDFGERLILVKLDSGDELGNLASIYNGTSGGRYAAKLALLTEKENAEAASRAKTDFLANMSHELRTPLNSIIGFSSRLIKKSKHELSDRNYQALDAINRNGVHLLDLINQILDLSKIESGKFELNYQDFSFSSILIDAITHIEIQANEKNIAIYKDIVDCSIEADATRVKQIIFNLLSNAIKYTKVGCISISTEKIVLDDILFILLKVKDTGIGIKEEDQLRLFTKFEQFDDSSRFKIGAGTGLGLALIQELTQLHNGIVEMSSVYGEGSEFRIFLPRYKT